MPNLRCNSLPDNTNEALIDQHKKQLNHAHGKELKDLPEGSTVSYYDHTGKYWRTSLVQERKDKSYIIANDRGLLISRNQVNLRPTNTDYIVHHNHGIPYSTNDSAVNIESSGNFPCIICGNMKQKKFLYVFDRRKYKKILKENDELEGILKDKEMKQYICKACHSNIQQQL